MAKYELLYIIPGKYSEEELPAIITSVKEILNKSQATLIKEEDLGKKKLAYNIGDSHYGYYILDVFTAEGPALAQIDKTLRLMPEILRHQVVGYIDPSKLAGQAPRIRPVEEKEAAKEPAKPEPTIIEAIKAEPTEAEKQKEAAKPKIDLDKLDEKLDELLKDDLNI